MDSTYLSNLMVGTVTVVVLVLLNGFFVAAEFSLVKVRETQLDALVLKGQRRAKIARRVLRNLDACLSATQLGITLASLGLGWFAEPIFIKLLEPVMRAFRVESVQLQHSLAFAIGFSVITLLHIVVGELAPKSLAIQKPLPTSMWVAQPLLWFYRFSYPLIWILNHSSLWLLRQVGLQPVSEHELAHSEEELRLLFATSQKSAGASRIGRHIVLNALDLRQRIVRDVMRPRREIIVLNSDASIAECLDVAEQTRYSRFPLCDGGDLDKTLGVVHIKDLYAHRLKAKRGRDLLPAVRKIIYVPETARLEKLLHLFLDRKLHLAIVVDEYGGTVGIVTLENILEELVGQIQDEFDQEKPLLTKTSDTVWEISGAFPLHELAELIGQPLAGEGITTTSGWVTQQLGGFPKDGDVLTLGPFELRVEAMEGLRVARLKLTRTVPVERKTSVPDL
ncbi:MAG: HlyC/CorC family transporter [Verrucomicrobia bacterium]|nr:HlyC/CorC family transporter [Verrucomicrobiota bacterium]